LLLRVFGLNKPRNISNSGANKPNKILFPLWADIHSGLAFGFGGFGQDGLFQAVSCPAWALTIQ
jgi:hypothetical protein